MSERDDMEKAVANALQGWDGSGGSAGAIEHLSHVCEEFNKSEEERFPSPSTTGARQMQVPLFVIERQSGNEKQYWACSSEHGTGWHPGTPKQAFTKSELAKEVFRIADSYPCPIYTVRQLQFFPDAEDRSHEVAIRLYDALYSLEKSPQIRLSAADWNCVRTAIAFADTLSLKAWCVQGNL